MTVDEVTQARIATNQARFREANENIEAAAEAIGVAGEIPFICECADPTCVEIVPLSLPEYAEVRRHPRRFFNAPGHEAISVESGAGVVIDERERYVLVEKVGVAGEIAAAEDDAPAESGGDG